MRMKGTTYIEPSRVLALRLDRRMSQEQLAKHAGLSRTAVRNAENGLTRPLASTLGKLARALGVKPSHFLAAPDTARR